MSDNNFGNVLAKMSNDIVGFAVANGLLGFFSLTNINTVVLICFTGISTLFLMYRFRIEIIKNTRAGLFAFRSTGKKIRITHKTSVRDLANILMDAEQTGDHDYANRALEEYYYLHNQKNLNGKQTQGNE